MSESLSISGTSVKASDARGGWNVDLNVVEDIEADIGCVTLPLAASMGAPQAVNLDALGGDGDGVIIKTPKEILVTMTHATGAVTAMPVRSLLLWMTAGLTGLSLQNTNTEQVLVTVAVTKKAT